MYKPLTDWYKNHLGKQVESVKVSNKLEDAPLYIFTSQYGYSARMEKINKAQAFANQSKAPSYMHAKKSLEINPHHGVMKKLLEIVKEAGEDGEVPADTKEYADLLFQMALVNSGFSIDEPMQLTEPLEKLIRVGFGVDRDEPIQDIEVEIEEEEEEEEEEEGTDELSEGGDTEEISLEDLDNEAEDVAPQDDAPVEDQLTIEEADDESPETLSDEL